MDNGNKCFYVSGEVTRFFLSGNKTIDVGCRVVAENEHMAVVSFYEFMDCSFPDNRKIVVIDVEEIEDDQ